MNRVVHICAFNGERLTQPEWEYGREPTTGDVFRDGQRITVEIPGVPFAAPRCEFETGRGRCRKPSAGGARYPWGCMALCAKHLDEECRPEPSATNALSSLATAAGLLR